MVILIDENPFRSLNRFSFPLYLTGKLNCWGVNQCNAHSFWEYRKRPDQYTVLLETIPGQRHVMSR